MGRIIRDLIDYIIYTYRISKNIPRPCYQDQLLQNNTINNGKKCCIAEKRGENHLYIKKEEAQNTMNVHSCNIKQTEQEVRWNSR